MECKLEFRAKAAMLAALLLTACGAETPLDGEAFESICYRGQVVMAERRGDALYVDFDLEATSSERWCNEEERSALRSLPQGAPALDTQGRRAPAPGTGSVWVGSDTSGAYWVGGVVPYEIDSSFSSTQRNRILNAMQHWEDRVPGIHFTPKDSSHASWIKFVLHSSACTSGYGRISGERTIRLTSGCTTDFSIHHEIGHALGLQHEHTRSDRDDFVVVQSSGADYQIDSGGDLFSYDFDSIMHYKLGGPITLAEGVTVPDGVTVGHFDHLSYLDVMSMNAMYPVARVHSPLFRNTGNQRLCRLEGREEDISTDFETSSSVGALQNGETVNTNGLATGDYGVTCVARSLFWSRNYDYPNLSAFNEPINSSNMNETQSYQHTKTVRVLDRGLLASMF
jgi:hypothetical protein